MTMKKILPFLTALIIGLGLSLQPAEAKRLGSGMNMGQQKQEFARKATPPSAPANATAGTAATGTAAAGATTAASGASKWMGPLAGLAAGGLLAALFFGGAFEGIQIMDVLLIALLALGIFMVVRAMRAKAAQAQQQAGYQYAAAGAPYDAAQQQAQAAPVASSTFDRSRTALSDAPAWFDEQGFLQAARKHFLALQMAWDMNDMEKVREYFTPDMFQQLRAQRAEIGDAPNHTDVQSLDAQLLDLVREGDIIVASVLFQGRVREDGNMPEDIAEIWHVQHAADSAQGDWLISGIQQADPRTLH